MKKIYSILGDFYHSHDYVHFAVSEAVKGIPDAELVDCRLREISVLLDEKPDVLVLACENRLNPQDEQINYWLTPELDEKLTAYVAGGGSFVAIHAALASYPKDSKYMEMLRGSFYSHPPEHYSVRYFSNDKLPFGGRPFDYAVVDEFYQLEVDEANTNVYMHSECDFGKGYGGWWHAYGEGKVLAIVPTHNEEGFRHAETIRLYREGLQWALN